MRCFDVQVNGAFGVDFSAPDLTGDQFLRTAEKILQAFKKDPDWHFKYDEPRTERRKRQTAPAPDAVPEEKLPRRPRTAAGKKPKAERAQRRTSLREEFWNWIGENE